MTDGGGAEAAGQKQQGRAGLKNIAEAASGKEKTVGKREEMEPTRRDETEEEEESDEEAEGKNSNLFFKIVLMATETGFTSLMLFCCQFSCI